MDWRLLIGIFAGIIQVVSIVPYVRSILRGTTRPNLISFTLWTGLQVISTAAQLSAGASWTILLLIGSTVNTVIVVLLCVAGYGYKVYARSDIVCFAIGAIGVVAWSLTGVPLLALVFSILASVCADIPTVIKTYRKPYSENALSWLMSSMAAFISIFSTTSYDLANVIYPAYLLIECGLIGMIALLGYRFRRKAVYLPR